VLIGAWKAFPTLAVLAGLGILVGVAYTLRAIQKAFYSGRPLPAAEAAREREANAVAHPLPAISVPERVGAAILLGTTLLIGLYPRLLLDLIRSGLETPLMSALIPK
jgi:NADH-quinone oxidoreductase subunit M